MDQSKSIHKPRVHTPTSFASIGCSSGTCGLRAKPNCNGQITSFLIFTALFFERRVAGGHMYRDRTGINTWFNQDNPGVGQKLRVNLVNYTEMCRDGAYSSLYMLSSLHWVDPLPFPHPDPHGDLLSF